MKPLRHIRRLKRDEDGSVLVFWGMALVVFLGFIALSFDLGRVAITQTDLQAYADSVALAAAGELDGNSDAITRATAAAAEMIQDEQHFGDGDTTLQGATDYTLTFLTGLPADDTDPTTAVTTDPSEASLVRVDVTAHTVGFTFGAAFRALRGSSDDSADVNAYAIAGFTQYACDVTPMMFCLPSPGYTADANAGSLIHLRSGGGASGYWGPGNFGFLDVSTGQEDPSGPCEGLSGINLDQCLLGAVGNITQCFAIDGVDTKPGQNVGNLEAAINIRFDMYNAGMTNVRNNPDYGPAPNVITGIVPNGGGSCIGNNPTPSPDTIGLPLDDCFATATCAAGNRFGDGDWSSGRLSYVEANYGDGDPLTDDDPHPGAVTRYDYYLAEIAAAGGAGSTNPILTGRAESGRPQCSPHQVPDPERRLLIAAGVDCTANPVSGHATGIPVEEFFQLFLVRPAGTTEGGNFDIWAEVVGSASSGSSSAGIFRDVVQLYR